VYSAGLALEEPTNYCVRETTSIQAVQLIPGGQVTRVVGPTYRTALRGLVTALLREHLPEGEEVLWIEYHREISDANECANRYR
jgi:hypothetical protein